MGGPTIDGSMLAPLLVMAVAFMAYFAALVIVRMRAELARRKVQTIRLNQAALAD